MGLSDEALVLACRRGDEAAWEALILRYQRLIYSIPRRAGLDKDQADEVFQQVFTTLLETLGRIEQPALIKAWLVTIARRETWRLIRRESLLRGATRASDGEADEAKDPPDSALLPDELLIRLEEQHAIYNAVALLDERCRRLLTLLFYRPDPPPYAEVAAELGMSEGSVGPTRARCLQKLRRCLGKPGL